MTTMLIANNCTRQNGQFMGDQLCYIKIAYLFVQNQPDVSRVIMTMSPGNEMGFLWEKFIETYNVEVVYDDFDPGDNAARWEAWDRWRAMRSINGVKFDHYRELYLRIHGAQRQAWLCGREVGRGNIYEYVYYGQEHLPTECVGADWYDDTLIHHPPHTPTRDVYIAPHCKTQGNQTFTFDFWATVVRHLLAAGVTVTVGYDGEFLPNETRFKRYWGDHREWLAEVCSHKLVACGNTGTGWVAAACGVPMITMEPHNSVMADHRYRECGLRNMIEVVDGFTLDSMNNDMNRVAEYVARRITAHVQQRLVMTTGCYDILHAGHIRHLQRSRALGTKLIVALNSDESVRQLKGETRPINDVNSRRTVLEALSCVDEVRVFDGPNALPLIRELKPDVLTAGFGYTEADIVGRELVPRAVVTCTGDAATEPSTTKVLKAVRAGDIVIAARRGAEHSVNSFAKLLLVAEHLVSVADLHGAIADLGSYKGGSALTMRLLSSKPLHLFDTWDGNPHDDPLCHYKVGEWKIDQVNCERVVGPTAYYHRGVFPSTAPTDAVFSFVYVDMDTERATRDAVEFFWPRMVYGGKMVFDDYGWEPCAGVKVAVDAAFSELERTVVAAQHTCVVVKR